MRENYEMNEDEIVIDIGELIKVLLINIKIIIGSSVIVGLLCFLCVTLFISKEYRSESTVYIPAVGTNNSLYVEFLQSDAVFSAAAEKMNGKSIDLLKSYTNVTNSTSTGIISISVTTTDPVLSKDITASVVNAFSEKMQNKFNMSVNILNEAKENNNPVSPNAKKITLLGICIGFILSCAIITLRYLLNSRLRTQEAAESFLGVPVLTIVPNMKEKENITLGKREA